MPALSDAVDNLSKRIDSEASGVWGAPQGSDSLSFDLLSK